MHKPALMALALCMSLASCNLSETPELEENGRWHKPTTERVILRSEIVEWPTPEPSITAWCYFGVLNLARIDNAFWALNGIARQRAGNTSVRRRGQAYNIVDVHATTEAHRRFANALNEKMNEKCP